MNECHLNFKIILRHALRHIRPQRHFVAYAFSNEIGKHKLPAIEFVNAIVRFPSSAEFPALSAVF